MSTVVPRIFFAAVIAIPFSGVAGVGALGEYSMEAAFYVFLPLMLFLPHFSKRALPREFYYILGAMSCAIFCSFFFNMEDIFSAQLKGRSGINKFATSLPVFYYGIAVTLITAYICRNLDSVRLYLVRPMLLASIFVCFVAIIELGAWFNSALFSIYDLLSQVLRAARWPSFTVGRLQSVTFEPSVLGLYLGFVLVILRFSLAITVSSARKFKYKLFFCLVVLLMIVCNARTASVLLVGLTLGHFLINLIVKADRRFQRVMLFVLAPAAIVSAVLGVVSLHDVFVSEILAGESVSNLSRYASNTAASTLFLENLLFGVGFGQYAFRAVDILPAWAWQSYEISNWFSDPEFTWPPVYSLPLRIAAETGVLGIVGWYGSLILLFSTVLKMIKTQTPGSLNAAVGRSMLWGIVYILLSGVSYDSFRNFAVWIILGLIFAGLKNWKRTGVIY